MANIRNGNTYYIDTASVTLDVPMVRVKSITLTATNATNALILGDGDNSYPTKLSLVGTNGVSLVFDYSLSPIYFANGIRVKTVTACTATVVLEESGA